MALARYRDTFWYPTGILAGQVPAKIFPLSSTVPAQLWTDQSGTVALSNPLSTDAFGVLEFWAEEGEYWIHIVSQSFRVSVGSPNSDVFEAASIAFSTGVISGGELSINAGNPGAVDISAMVGYVMDFLTDDVRPTAVRVSTPNQTIPLDAAALLRAVTHWVVLSDGTVVQQANRPTAEEMRTLIYLGATSQSGGVILLDQTLPVIMAQPGNQFVDLLDSLGAFSISGNRVTPNGVNLSINKEVGTVFARAINLYTPSGRTNRPHIGDAPAQTPVSFRYTLRTSAPFSANTTLINPTQYDNNGVLTAVGGGAGSSTIQRVWLIPGNNTSDQVVIQYGQVVFSSLATAIDNIGSGVFIPRPGLPQVAALVAWICVTRTATNLSDTTQCVIVTADKFSTP